MREECDFCLIGRESHRVLFQNEYVTSFLSDPRLTPGHSLIVPNRHLILPEQLDDNEILAMYREADRLGGLMLGSIAVGVDRWQKTRPHTAETAIKRDHIHMHVLPSQEGQPLYDTGITWGEGAVWLPLALEEKTSMVSLLRAA